MISMGISRIYLVILFGVLLRCSLRFSVYHQMIAKRVEVSSPFNAWIRAKEGVFLLNIGIDPYDGNTFHESPLFLHFYRFLIEILEEYQLFFVFVLADILTALVFSKVVLKQSKSIVAIDARRLKLKDSNDPTCANLLIKPESTSSNAESIIWIYLLCPYAILPCVAQSTSVFTNLLVAMIFLAATNNHRHLSLFLLSLITLNTFYLILLLPSICLILEHNTQHRNSDRKFRSIIYSLFIFIISLISLIGISILFEKGSLKFIDSVYVFRWTVSDLTPNIGVFWYFFSEIFDHFRSFFIWIFQINFFIYIIPLTMRLKENPYFLSFITLVNHSIFKPYPTVSDLILFLCLLPQWSHLFRCKS
ncbi:phosphatidylinositol glycan anchor biosynthesis class U protein-like protein [Sarcoptes scabiei]|uniref:Phosphatidylinositol glycan anchor biosynthesis class U protein-like protein n=1 Tax=Sarcoptes scabiei TaxID=52283 RepID=A0A132A2G7_SARSC|nr:phosphatidylinositol glycan anchor biosynthesis class U protein-like protein [Sarcoptes scabiei]